MYLLPIQFKFNLSSFFLLFTNNREPDVASWASAEDASFRTARCLKFAF
jgi:hypothetical protein